jgi:hypothetical protein
MLYPGSKHWPTDAQQRLWEWFKPFMKQIFGQNIQTDTLMIWTSFLEVCIQYVLRKPKELTFSQ